MVEVPLQYFREDFSPDWDLLGPIDSAEKQQIVVEELSSQLVSTHCEFISLSSTPSAPPSNCFHYYYISNIQDRIETHLTSEIAGRYSSFFEASIYIQELREDLQRLLEHAAEKRGSMKTVVAGSEEAASTAIALRKRKERLLETLDLAMVSTNSNSFLF